MENRRMGQGTRTTDGGREGRRGQATWTTERGRASAGKQTDIRGSVGERNMEGKKYTRELAEKDALW